MRDAASEVIAIREAARELREALAPMALNEKNAEQIRKTIVKLQAATHNLTTWLNDQKVL